jgi:hypothetical protein
LNKTFKAKQFIREVRLQTTPQSRALKPALVYAGRVVVYLLILNA